MAEETSIQNLKGFMVKVRSVEDEMAGEPGQ